MSDVGNDSMRYLTPRGPRRRWHYERRVPTACAHLDTRGSHRKSLKTTSLEVAKKRRDEFEVADNIYWEALTKRDLGAVERYAATIAQALTLNLTYRTAAEISSDETIKQILKRVEILGGVGIEQEHYVEAVLGGVERPRVTITDAFEVYKDKLCLEQLETKSLAQRKNWANPKNRAVENFIALVGNNPLADITRDMALEFYDWWADRINPEDEGVKPLSGSAGNRDVGNMRTLFDRYFRYVGEEDRRNPFRNLSFPEGQARKILPFPTGWIEKQILNIDAFEGLNDQAKHIYLCRVETGARASEIANILEEDIHLNANVPHISIEPKLDREIKTKASKRIIPLCGVSLEAFRRFPAGFDRYRDNGDSLSAALGKHFRKKKLFPSPDHRVNSIRHSFEKRMLEAGLDYGLRCDLMGHSNDRPAYGDGGSLAFRLAELQKIELPFSPALFSRD